MMMASMMSKSHHRGSCLPPSQEGLGLQTEPCHSILSSDLGSWDSVSQCHTTQCGLCSPCTPFSTPCLNPLPEQAQLNGRNLSPLCSQLLHNQGGAILPDVLPKRCSGVWNLRSQGSLWKNISWKIHPQPALSRPLSCRVCSLLEVHNPLVVYVPNPELGASAI